MLSPPSCHDVYLLLLHILLLTILGPSVAQEQETELQTQPTVVVNQTHHHRGCRPGSSTKRTYDEPPPPVLPSVRGVSASKNGAAAPAARCINGIAAATSDNGQTTNYPCQNVDLESYLNIPDMRGPTAGNADVYASDIWGWTDPSTGKEYAIILLDYGTAFVDISTPSNPIYIGRLNGRFGARTEWRDIKTYQNHAFIVADYTSNGQHNGMQVFDLTRLRRDASSTTPELFTEDAHYDGITTAHNIVINEDSGTAFMVGGPNTESGCTSGLHMVNISNPTLPTFLGCWGDDGYVHDAQCVNYNGPDTRYHGSEICFTFNEDTVNVVDVTDKSNPTQLSKKSYAKARYAHQGWATEDHRYLFADDEGDENGGGSNRVDGTTTYIWDISNLESPSMIGTYVGASRAIDHNQYIKGSYSFQANYHAGLRILDVSDVGNVHEVAYFDVYPQSDNSNFNGAWGVYPFFGSGIVIISSIERGLFVLRPLLDQTDIPTGSPTTSTPTLSPTEFPTGSPTTTSPIGSSTQSTPTLPPTEFPTGSPATTSPPVSSTTSTPTLPTREFPTRSPITLKPSRLPTKIPTLSPIEPSSSISPTESGDSECRDDEDWNIRILVLFNKGCDWVKTLSLLKCSLIKGAKNACREACGTC